MARRFFVHDFTTGDKIGRISGMLASGYSDIKLGKFKGLNTLCSKYLSQVEITSFSNHILNICWKHTQNIKSSIPNESFNLPNDETNRFRAR